MFKNMGLQNSTNNFSTTRIISTASAASITLDAGLYDAYLVTALAVGCVINAPTNPSDGQPIIFRIKDNGSAQTLSWDAVFRAVGVTLPTATTASKTTYVVLS